MMHKFTLEYNGKYFFVVDRFTLQFYLEHMTGVEYVACAWILSDC